MLPVIDDELIEDIDAKLLHGSVLLDSGLEIEVQHGKLIDHPGDAFTPPPVRPVTF